MRSGPRRGLGTPAAESHALIAGNYTYAAAVAKSDTVDQPQVGSNVASGSVPIFDAIYVGGAGIVVVALIDNTTVQFTAVAGEIIPIRGRRVNNTTTTATLMVALYYI